MLKSRATAPGSAAASTDALAENQLSGAAPASTRPVFYWVTTVVATLAFNVPGVLNLVRAPHIARDMAHLGYPPYFLTILGTWKVLGGIVVAAPGLPRLK